MQEKNNISKEIDGVQNPWIAVADKYNGIGSLEFTKKLVLHILNKKEDNIVLVLRGSTKWEALLKNEYNLKSSDKVIINTNRSQSISPNNLGDIEFKKICKLLSKNE